MTRYIGIDYGTKRVGLAISDSLGLTARPLEVARPDEVVERLRSLIAEFDVTTVVVGLPTGLRGHEGVSASGARSLADLVRDELGIDVELIDERFTSRMAESALIESGMRRRERRANQDKVAAAIILQSYLDRSANTGNARPGSDVEEQDTHDS